MSMNSLQLGFIGGAVDSAVGTTHKIACQMDQRWKLAAGCFSTEPDINFHTAELWGIGKDRTYDSWQEFIELEKDRLDAISILTPTPLHKEMVSACLDHNIPVVCEKSLTCKAQETKEIQNELSSNQGFLAVTYNYTGYPMLRELRALIEEKKLGTINQIHIEMPQEGFLRLGKNNEKPRPQEWRLVDNTVPTLSLDLAVHIHQIVDFLIKQKPIELVALNNNFGFFENIVDNTMCIARYSGNIDCQIWFGKTALGHSNGLKVRVYGSEGSATWFQLDPESIHLSDNLGKTYTIDKAFADLKIAGEERYSRFKAGHPAGFIEAFANYYYDIADSLIAHKRQGIHHSPWVCGADTAYEGLLMLEAMATSAKNKSWAQVGILN